MHRLVASPQPWLIATSSGVCFVVGRDSAHLSAGSRLASPLCSLITIRTKGLHPRQASHAPGRRHWALPGVRIRHSPVPERPERPARPRSQLQWRTMCRRQRSALRRGLESHHQREGVRHGRWMGDEEVQDEGTHGLGRHQAVGGLMHAITGREVVC